MQSSSLGTRALLLGIVLVALPGCQMLFPDSDPETASQGGKGDEPLFDADYYAQNAKEYFEGRQYARARDQWQNQLKLEPESWMAKLGIASCDYFMGSNSLDRGDLRTGRDLLARAEAATRELWDGEIEKSTIDSIGKPVQPWRAAIFLAMSLRGLGDADNLQSVKLAQRLSTLKATDPKHAEVEAELARLKRQHDENHKASLVLFERLAAMEYASPDAVLNVAELYVGAGRTDEAEREFLRYVEMAKATRADLLAKREEIENADVQDASFQSVSLGFIDEKIKSNLRKHVAVLVRLGNIHYDRAEAAREKGRGASLSPIERRAIEDTAMEHLSRALGHLRNAHELEKDRFDLLVKMAQCQGDMNLYEPAIANLDAYIRESSERDREWDENLNRAFRLKAEYERKLAAR